MSARVASRVARLERAHGAGPCPGCRLVRRVVVVKKGDPRPALQPCAVCGRHPAGPVRVVVLDVVPEIARAPEAAPTPEAPPAPEAVP